MIDDLKELLIEQINEVFPGKKVYDESIQQGLKPPAFLLLIFNDAVDRQIRHRWKREIHFNVTYFPEDEREADGERDRVAELFKVRFRRIAGKYHVNKLEAVKHDGTLVISFTVKAIQEEQFDETKMESLEVR